MEYPTCWTGTVVVHRAPYCPSCGSALEESDWRAVAAIAMCNACRDGNGKGLLAIVSAITTHPVNALLTRRSGLAFYTPTLNGPPGRPPMLYYPPPYLEHPRVIAALRLRAEGQ
jgi:hypothetical protein